MSGVDGQDAKPFEFMLVAESFDDLVDGSFSRSEVNKFYDQLDFSFHSALTFVALCVTEVACCSIFVKGLLQGFHLGASFKMAGDA
jgi:hypothetical protein